MTAAALLRAASLAVERRVSDRRARMPWSPRPARQARPVARIGPVVQVGVPWHSDACYCPVMSVALLPCGNCRRDKPLGATP